jgi:hypothetical protein
LRSESGEASRDRGKIPHGASEVVDTLREALQADAPAVRVRAATVLLEGAVKVELDDLGRRVEALEAAQKGSIR